MDSLKIKHPAYKPGDVIVEAAPLIYSINPGANDYCANCFGHFTSAKLNKCGQCYSFSYCSRQCQRDDWTNFHKHECKFYAKFNKDEFLQEKFIRISLRILIFMQHRKSEMDVNHNIIGDQVRCYNDLKDHKDDLMKTRSLFYHRVTMYFRMRGFKFDINEFLLALCRFNINAFSISNMRNKSVGTGLYIESSIFNHSCRPNAGTCFIGNRQQIRAVDYIEQDAPIFVTYLDLATVHKERYDHLLNCYFFKCQCIRCIEDDYLEDDKKVNEIIALRTKFESIPEDVNNKNVPEVIHLLDTIALKYEEVYGMYNRITAMKYIESIEARVSLGNFATFNVEKVIKIITVTHGIEHQLYQYLTDLLTSFKLNSIQNDQNQKLIEEQIEEQTQNFDKLTVSTSQLALDKINNPA